LGKPVERRGRKATGLNRASDMAAGLPMLMQIGNLCSLISDQH
jgi:hypothetical protein